LDLKSSTIGLTSNYDDVISSSPVFLKAGNLLTRLSFNSDAAAKVTSFSGSLEAVNRLLLFLVDVLSGLLTDLDDRRGTMPSHIDDVIIK
jgi:hypothetical protein